MEARETQTPSMTGLPLLPCLLYLLVKHLLLLRLLHLRRRGVGVPREEGGQGLLPAGAGLGVVAVAPAILSSWSQRSIVCMTAGMTAVIACSWSQRSIVCKQTG